jgi:hypothetical protein
MGFLKGCGNARRINSRSSAKWFTYQSVAIRCHLNEKASWRNQALALRTPVSERYRDIATTAKQPGVLDCVGNNSPTRIPFPDLNGPRSTTDLQIPQRRRNENYKAVVDLHVLRHGCAGGLEPNGEWPVQARHPGILGSSDRCISPRPFSGRRRSRCCCANDIYRDNNCYAHNHPQNHRPHQHHLCGGGLRD